jgi:hypothetical protein
MNVRRQWKVATLLALLLAAGGLVACWALARPEVHVGGPSHASNQPSVAEIDHDAYERLLQNYVDDRGLVEYERWKATSVDVQVLDDYLASLGSVDLGKTASNEARVAFWINAYNALTLKGILREYPTSSIRNHTAELIGYNIWKHLLLWVDKDNYSLDDIEHKILRKLGEPRIHFAIVCASIGCPPLADRAYTAQDLDKMLTANAVRFFAQPSNFRADPGQRAIRVSQLLKWYGTDFAPTPAEQMRMLRAYFPAPEAFDWIDASPITVEYLEYDWSLNDQKSP